MKAQVRRFTKSELEQIWASTFWDAMGRGHSEDEAEEIASSKVDLLGRK